MTTEVLEKLENLLSENQFELIESKNKEEKEYRLIYLMNDAVESFLIFQNAVMTGTYQKDYEGALDAVLQETDDGYALVVHQGETVCTLFFEDLILENQLYNYGQVGHFWVTGQEHLRVLEYQIAIMRDKYDYLGEEHCNLLEQILCVLTEFPPLNYSCYPAVPEKYLVPMPDPWHLSEEAADFMIEIVEELGNDLLERKIRQYKEYACRHQDSFLGKGKSKRMAREIAGLLAKKESLPVVIKLLDLVEEAADEYPDRVFSPEVEPKYQTLWKKTKDRAGKLQQRGYQTRVYRQEPFVYDCDQVEFAAYVLWWDEAGNIHVEEVA